MDVEDAVLARLSDSGLLGDITAYGEHPDQLIEWYGAPDAPILVIVHGGFFRPSIDRDHARPQAAALADAGWRVALLEYRRVPGSPDLTLADLCAADAAIGETALWVGHSAGGALVLLRALDADLTPVRAVSLAGINDLDRAVREGLGGGAVADWLGPDGRVENASARIDNCLALSGDADQTVPPSYTLQFPGPHRLLPGAHHADLVDPESPHWPTVVAALRDWAEPS